MPKKKSSTATLAESNGAAEAKKASAKEKAKNGRARLKKIKKTSPKSSRKRITKRS